MKINDFFSYFGIFKIFFNRNPVWEELTPLRSNPSSSYSLINRLTTEKKNKDIEVSFLSDEDESSEVELEIIIEDDSTYSVKKLPANSNNNEDAPIVCEPDKTFLESDSEDASEEAEYYHHQFKNMQAAYLDVSSEISYLKLKKVKINYVPMTVNFIAGLTSLPAIGWLYNSASQYMSALATFNAKYMPDLLALNNVWWNTTYVNVDGQKLTFPLCSDFSGAPQFFGEHAQFGFGNAYSDCNFKLPINCAAQYTCSSFDANCSPIFNSTCNLITIDNPAYVYEVIPNILMVIYSALIVGTGIITLGAYDIYAWNRSKTSIQPLDDIETNQLIEKLAKYSITVSEDFFSTPSLNTSQRLAMLDLLITNHWKTAYHILTDDFEHRRHRRKEFYFQNRLLRHFGWKEPAENTASLLKKEKLKLPEYGYLPNEIMQKICFFANIHPFTPKPLQLTAKSAKRL